MTRLLIDVPSDDSIRETFTHITSRQESHKDDYCTVLTIRNYSHLYFVSSLAGLTKSCFVFVLFFFRCI